MGVGFIGIGNMGWGMAANSVKAGFDVTVFDADTERSERFSQEYGCHSARLIGDLAASDVIVTMLPTGPIVHQVLMDNTRGLAGVLKPGTIVIDMSSSEPVGTRKLGAELAERGVVLIDAPVSGGVVRANSGKLAIMIGTDDSTSLERIQPLLLAMGDRLFQTGALGSGHAMKALNNYVAAACFTATAEALLIGERFGLDQSKMLEVMNASTGRNFHSEVVMKEHVVDRKFGTGFAVGLLAKDVKIAADLGEAVGLDAPLSRMVCDRWAYARDHLGANRDNTEAILAWNEDLKSRA